MADPARPTPTSPLQVAGIVVVTGVILNLAFYFLSDAYFTDRASRLGPTELAGIARARGAFAMFVGAVGAAAFVAVIAPRWIGHGLALLAGIGSLITGIAAFSSTLPGVLGVTLVVTGLLFPVVTWRSFVGSRAAWSALIAMCSVFALVLLFGAPKVRGLFDVGLWTALIFPGLFAVAAIALWMLHPRYGTDD